MDPKQRKSDHRSVQRFKVEKHIFNFLMSTKSEELKQVDFHRRLSMQGVGSDFFVCGPDDDQTEQTWSGFLELYKEAQRTVLKERIKLPRRIAGGGFPNDIQSKFDCICTRIGRRSVDVVCLEKELERIKEYAEQQTAALDNDKDNADDSSEGENELSDDDMPMPYRPDLNNSIPKENFPTISRLPCGYEIGGVFKVFLYTSDLTALHVGAIVNAANSTRLIGKSGVSKAIKDGAGTEYVHACEEVIRIQNTLPISSVVRTTSGKLPCKMVLHTVGPKWPLLIHTKTSHSECLAKLYKTFRNILWYAEANNAGSVAIPPVSSGSFKVPKEHVAETLFNALLDASTSQRCGIVPMKEVHVVDITETFLFMMSFKLHEASQQKSSRVSVLPLPMQEVNTAIEMSRNPQPKIPMTTMASRNSSRNSEGFSSC